MTKPRDEHPDVEYFPTESSTSLDYGLMEPPFLLAGARIRMIFFFLLSLLVMAVHHCFCSSLNGRAVNTDFIDGMRISQQSIASAVSNAIASSAAFSLAAVVGVAMEQVMWFSFRHKPHTIREIDAILKCRTNPFVPEAWSAWKATRCLTGLAIMGAAMTFITVFAPGSLTTTSVDFVFKESCKIPTVDTSQGNYHTEWIRPNTSVHMSYPSPYLRKLVMKVAVSSDYIRPVSPCGVCSYGITLNALAMTCLDITDTYNFTLMAARAGTEKLIIWDVTDNFSKGGKSIIVATANVTNFDMSLRAVDCSIHNATYDLQVTHENSTSAVKVNQMSINQPLHKLDMTVTAPDARAMHSLATATAQHLKGVEIVDVDTMELLLDIKNPLVMNTNIFSEALGGFTQPGTWLWRDSMLNLLPELMTNISISMLTNPIGAAERSITTECSYSGVVFAYKPTQLLLTYGIGVLSAFLCCLVGLWAISQNHSVEESGRFSRLLLSVLNDRMFEKPLHRGTRLQAEDTPEGYLVPVRTDTA